MNFRSAVLFGVIHLFVAISIYCINLKQKQHHALLKDNLLRQAAQMYWAAFSLAILKTIIKGRMQNENETAML